MVKSASQRTVNPYFWVRVPAPELRAKVAGVPAMAKRGVAIARDPAATAGDSWGAVSAPLPQASVYRTADQAPVKAAHRGWKVPRRMHDGSSRRRGTSGGGVVFVPPVPITPPPSVVLRDRLATRGKSGLSHDFRVRASAHRGGLGHDWGLARPPRRSDCGVANIHRPIRPPAEVKIRDR